LTEVSQQLVAVALYSVLVVMLTQSSIKLMRIVMVLSTEMNSIYGPAVDLVSVEVV
jgi:hypothetical protein